MLSDILYEPSKNPILYNKLIKDITLAAEIAEDNNDSLHNRSAGIYEHKVFCKLNFYLKY